MSKFKSLTGKDKWILLLTMGLALCILAFPVEWLTSDHKKTESDGDRDRLGMVQGDGTPIDSVSVFRSGTEGTVAQETYEKALENRIRQILRKVSGVGEVDVMVVLKSSSEKIWQTDESSSASTEESGEDGELRRFASGEKEVQTVLVAKDGTEEPMLTKEFYPEVSGIIISAQGGDSPSVQAEISAAMEALFGLPAHKIKVLKRVE
ncbi:MAG: stage III sporulation protein AG [Clostridiales bacterium]|nr:stage III sporulation protein AG [Clostridiales bacterium]